MEEGSTKNHTELKVLKRQSKSFEALQQAAVLTILMYHGFGFIFKKPERRSTKTVQSLLISKIILPNQNVIDYDKEIDALCCKLANAELQEIGYPELSAENVESIASINKVVMHGYNIEKLKTVKRHREANKNSLAFNQLLTYLYSLGYSCSTRQSKPASFTTKMIKITGISNVDEDGKCMSKSQIDIRQEEIEYIGMKMNEYIYGKFIDEENELTIDQRSRSFVTSLLFTHVSINGSVLKSFCGTQRGENVIEIKADLTSKINQKANGTVNQQIEEEMNEMEMDEEFKEEQEMKDIQEQINDIVLDQANAKTTQGMGEMTVQVEESLYDVQEYQNKESPNTISTISQLSRASGSNIEMSQIAESQKDKEESMEYDETYKAISEYYSHFEDQTDGFLSWGGGFY